MTLPSKNPTRPSASVQLRERLRLEDDTSEPYYLQLQRQLQALVTSGDLPVGTSMPSERDLAEALQVSRATVKRTYDGLRRGQVLVSTGTRGGTSVHRAPHVSPIMSRLKGFTEEMTELGLVPATRVLERDVVQDRTVASVFGKPSTAELLRLVRLRLADDAPMSREVAWYDVGLAPALVNWSGEGSAYDFLRTCGIALSWAEQSVEAVISSAPETAVFGFGTPSPCLLLKRLTYTVSDQLAEYAEGTFRGDAYRYRLKLQV